jgi:tetratricopeptide (TPR) repeat protein
MTSHETFIERLCEIMLENEKHLLSVDDLFEDSKIGDFAKSIQIDSPYQQLLLSSVLTETVIEEKLYVSFTFEGYFHYVLGEIIHDKAKGKTADFLITLGQNNQLKGLAEGIEQSLIREVRKGNLSGLMLFIDSGYKVSKICTMPLVTAFLCSNHINLKQSISSILRKLFKNYTAHDIELISEVISVLKNSKKEEYLEIICTILSKKIDPATPEEYQLLIDTLKYLTPQKRKKLLFKIHENVLAIKEMPIDIYFELGNQYEQLSWYDIAIDCYRYCIRKNIEDKYFHIRLYRHLAQVYLYSDELDKAIYYAKKSIKMIGDDNEQVFEKSCNFSTIGEAYRQKESYATAKKYQQQALNISLKHYGKYDISTATSYNNLGLTYRSSGDYKKAKELYEESYRVKNNLYSNANESLIVTINNLGVVNRYLDNFGEAISFYKKSLEYSEQINGEQHVMTATILYNLAIVYKNISDIDQSIIYCAMAVDLFEDLLGKNHSSYLMAKEKLETLKNL